MKSLLRVGPFGASGVNSAVDPMEGLGRQIERILVHTFPDSPTTSPRQPRQRIAHHRGTARTSEKRLDPQDRCSAGFGIYSDI
jgi:hypothetical protein